MGPVAGIGVSSVGHLDSCTM